MSTSFISPSPAVAEEPQPFVASSLSPSVDAEVHSITLSMDADGGVGNSQEEEQTGDDLTLREKEGEDPPPADPPSEDLPSPPQSVTGAVDVDSAPEITEPTPSSFSASVSSSLPSAEEVVGKPPTSPAAAPSSAPNSPPPLSPSPPPLVAPPHSFDPSSSLALPSSFNPATSSSTEEGSSSTTSELTSRPALFVQHGATGWEVEEIVEQRASRGRTWYRVKWSQHTTTHSIHTS